jgi:restriction system protein
LANVEPLACLKHLSAGVSKSPAELVPVRPVLEFDMVDPRFGAESDAPSVIDQRPDLLDCVAYDSRPIFGGKVVIQAKRCTATVGVSAVRDLYGTLHNEGASKGILVTTSGYGPASFDFANNKPIELIDGSNLLYLLREHAGVDAKIEPPDTWVPSASDPE